METTNLFVYTNPIPGQDDAFNDWYDNTHLAQILALPMVVSAQRFRLSPTGVDGTEAGSLVDTSAPLPHVYLAVYEVTGDPTVAVQAITDGCVDGSIELHESFDVAGTLSIKALPLSPVRTG
ncbi:MAG TPA: hypothetical protein VE074_18015 [Jatrophihabitantaceae bacterium]|nr:hypothetical protein [Jatrophihabitantaceae bacterium]